MQECSLQPNWKWSERQCNPHVYQLEDDKTDLCKDSCNEKPAIAKENVADVYGHENCKPYCCGGETTQAALCVLYDPIVCVKREVCERADVRGGGASHPQGERMYTKVLTVTRSAERSRP